MTDAPHTHNRPTRKGTAWSASRLPFVDYGPNLAEFGPNQAEAPATTWQRSHWRAAQRAWSARRFRPDDPSAPGSEHGRKFDRRLPKSVECGPTLAEIDSNSVDVNLTLTAMGSSLRPRAMKTSVDHCSRTQLCLVRPQSTAVVPHVGCVRRSCPI